MIALALAFALTAAAAPLGPVEAAARLQALRDGFSAQPAAQSIAALERLADDAAGTEAAGQALVWLGDLAAQARDLERARDFYARAASLDQGEVRRLALRGAGDVALASGRFAEAQGRYEDALVGATPLLALELRQKHGLAARLAARLTVERLAWLLVAATLVGFVWRSRPWRGLRAPTELIYVVPVYGLLVIGGIGRDPAVLRALMLGAVGSTLLIGSAGTALGRVALTRATVWQFAALLLVANLALFYAVVNRAGLTDTLLVTFRIAAG